MPSPAPRESSVGVLLAQLGTPDAPTPAALRRYLTEFLSDRRVVDLPRLIWWPLLHGVILRLRPRRSAALYRNIWTEKGSPLLIHTRSQAEGLEARLGRRCGLRIPVVYGMRYGNPGLREAVDSLIAGGCDRILLFPLYPQYSVATTASVLDVAVPHILTRPAAPELRVVPPFPTHPGYLRALAACVREALEPFSRPPDRILISFHGEPVTYRARGDPYERHCRETAEGLATELELDEETWSLVFQSRFGPARWLEPYLDRTLENLARSGVKTVVAAMPGFVADCLETLDEVGREGLRQFRAAGGESLTAVPCLNGHPLWLDALADIAEEWLQGWIPVREAG